MGSAGSSFGSIVGACAIFTGSFGIIDANDIAGSSEATSIIWLSGDLSDSSSAVSLSSAVVTSGFMSVGSIRISWPGVSVAVVT